MRLCEVPIIVDFEIQNDLNLIPHIAYTFRWVEDS